MIRKRIGVILPAYNEGVVIGRVLAGLPRTITVQRTTYELAPVVVDDGSLDQTAAEAGKFPHVVVIRHLMNSGAGAATRTGLRYLRSRNFAYGATMDADGQHAPEDLERVLAAAITGQGNLIIGSRLINTEGMPRHKILGNKGLSLVTRVVLGSRSTDSQSGLRALDRAAIDRLTYRENTYAFCSEMLWRAQKAGLTIAEVPIAAIYTDYSRKKGQNSWNAFNIVKRLIKRRLVGLLHE